jgi:hypothetical protein
VLHHFQVLPDTHYTVRIVAAQIGLNQTAGNNRSLIGRQTAGLKQGLRV